MKSKNFLRKGLLRGLVIGTLGLIATNVSAQTITTNFSSGTSTTSYLPIYGLYGYSYSQQIYLPTDFNTLVQGQSNYITKIRFYNVTGSLTNATSWTVYMGNTNQAAFSSTTNWIASSSMTQVYTGTLSAPSANSWMEITLSTPFLWDGTSNVVVAVDENTSGYSSITWGSVSTTGSNRAILYRNDGTNPDPATPPTATATYAYVPKMQFVHGPNTPCSGTPTQTTASGTLSTVCAADSTEITFSLSNLDFTTGFDFTWQYNDGSGWQNYPNSNAETFTTYLTASSNVRAIVSCTNSGLQSISNEASVIVNPSPTISVDNNELTYCSGSPATITASGASTYSWSPSTGLTSTTGATVSATPSSVTSYIVTGTAANGCTGTASSIVYPATLAQNEGTFSPVQLCQAGAPVTITQSVQPSTIAGGGNWEYRFIDATGNTVQNWNSSNTFTFIPTTDSLYSYYYQARIAGCSDVLDSAVINIPVGFGANIDVTNYNCLNLGGTIALTDVFGQTSSDTVYTNPLADPTTDATNVSFSGSGSIVNGYGQLTASATSASGSITINDPAFHTGLNNAMTISFDLTADQPINTYGTGGADGLSYSFGNDVSTTGHQNGSGSKLRLSFDAAGNSPNATGIYLVYGYTGGITSTGITPTGTTTLAYSTDLNSWKLQNNVPVVLSIDENGLASLTVNGISIFSGVQMPAAYMNANTTGWKHVFGAATGGDAMRQAVSNVVITAPSLKYALVTENTTPTSWQTTSTFTDVQPGTYDVWISSGDGSCDKLIETVDLLNTNPLVDLGNDTTICEGATITLDAENTGASYVWSNSNITTQTYDVTEAGAYVVYVTDSIGCVGVGSVNVNVDYAPTASGIYVENNFPLVTYSVLNAQYADQYDWNFGDGTTITNGPSTITHYYGTDGTFNVSAVLSNDCGSDTISQAVDVVNIAGIDETTFEGLSIYPNPVSSDLTIKLPEGSSYDVQVLNVAGSIVATYSEVNSSLMINVQNWEKGMYLLKISGSGRQTVQKVVVR